MCFSAVLRSSKALRAVTVCAVVLLGCVYASAADAPRIVQRDGRSSLFVDGKPFLILGGQIHNSSAWPSELPQVWQSMAALHANTIEAPIYWEQLESEPGHFDFTNVDQIVQGARTNNLHVILLWFGTWKNGNMHYVPAWVKNDTAASRESFGKTASRSTYCHQCRAILWKPIRPRSRL
jgi:beta-galactosidase GanA